MAFSIWNVREKQDYPKLDNRISIGNSCESITLLGHTEDYHGSDKNKLIEGFKNHLLELSM